MKRRREDQKLAGEAFKAGEDKEEKWKIKEEKKEKRASDVRVRGEQMRGRR